MKNIFNDIRTLTLANIDEIYKLEIETYPEKLQDSLEEIKYALNSSKLHFGAFYQNKLIGFLLSLKENNKNGEIYLYDFTIDQKFQRRGLGKYLVNLFLKKALINSLTILICCRTSSQSIFKDREFLASSGYKLTNCNLEIDGYFPVCGIHEDLYMITLKPINISKS